MIRPVTALDALQIAEIYNHYIAHSTITFEEETVTADEMKRRIVQVTKHFPWLVFEDNNELVGYAYANEWRSRSAYRFSAESTIYLKKEFTGKGIGISLYQQLLEESKKQKIHSLIGGIALPNNASIALHEKLGFKKVAHFQQVGFKLNKWVDVAYWQLMLSSEI